MVPEAPANLRIGLVTRQFPPDSVGGIGTYVRSVAEALAQAGHDPVVIHAAPGQKRSSAVQDGVQVERFPESGPEWLWRIIERRSRHLSSRLRAAVSAFQAVRCLDSFDVIEAPEWKAEAFFLRWAHRGPLVVHLHLSNSHVFANAAYPSGPGVRIAQWMELRSARYATIVSASSRISTIGPNGDAMIEASRLRIVTPPAPDVAWRTVPPVVDTEPVVLFVGRLERLKFPELILDALASLSAVPQARAVFVGEPYTAPDGRPYDEFLRVRSEALGVRCEVIDRTSDRSQLMALFGSARVIAVPSRFETLSMVVIEAMAAARPVVMSSAVGAGELLADDVSAPAVELDDLEGWTRALGRFLRDPLLAAAAGAANRARLDSLVTTESLLLTRLSAYRDAMTAPPPSWTRRSASPAAAYPSHADPSP